MGFIDDGTRIHYKSHRTHRGAARADFVASYGPVGEVYRSELGTLDHWLTERYCLYTTLGERLYRADQSRQEHDGGSGLGLAIAKAIVEMHHGSISAQSVLNHGTTMTILLPSVKGTAQLNS